MHVLVIEDDTIYGELVRMALTRAGFEATVIPNAIDGIEVAREMLPAAIVMDIALPKMSGLQAITVIRNDPQLADTPIIVATASGTSQTRFEAQKSGADMFLEKPFAMSELIELLNQLR